MAFSLVLSVTIRLSPAGWLLEYHRVSVEQVNKKSLSPVKLRLAVSRTGSGQPAKVKWLVGLKMAYLNVLHTEKVIVFFHVGVHVWTNVLEDESKFLWCMANIMQSDDIVVPEQPKQRDLTDSRARGALVVFLKDLFKRYQVVAEPRAAQVNGGVGPLAESVQFGVGLNFTVA